MFYFAKFCCLCLNFEGELNDICNDDIMEKITACIPDFEINDTLPTFICPICSEKLDSFFKFRNQCLKSEYYLNEYINKFKTIMPTINKSDIVNTRLIVTLGADFQNPEKRLKGEKRVRVEQDPATKYKFKKCKVMLRDVKEDIKQSFKTIHNNVGKQMTQIIKHKQMTAERVELPVNETRDLLQEISCDPLVSTNCQNPEAPSHDVSIKTGPTLDLQEPSKTVVSTKNKIINSINENETGKLLYLIGTNPNMLHNPQNIVSAINVVPNDRNEGPVLLLIVNGKPQLLNLNVANSKNSIKLDHSYCKLQIPNVPAATPSVINGHQSAYNCLNVLQPVHNMSLLRTDRQKEKVMK